MVIGNQSLDTCLHVRVNRAQYRSMLPLAVAGPGVARGGRTKQGVLGVPIQTLKCTPTHEKNVSGKCLLYTNLCCRPILGIDYRVPIYCNLNRPNPMSFRVLFLSPYRDRRRSDSSSRLPVYSASLNACLSSPCSQQTRHFSKTIVPPSLSRLSIGPRTAAITTVSFITVLVNYVAP